MPGTCSDNTNSYLKVAHCNDRACTNATATAIDTAANTGRTPSVTIGTDGLGLISYGSNGYLTFAHCRNQACMSASLSTPVKFALGRQNVTNTALCDRHIMLPRDIVGAHLGEPQRYREPGLVARERMRQLALLAKH